MAAKAVDVVGGKPCCNPSRPLAQRASPECYTNEVLDVSSADSVSPESSHPRLATSEDNLLAAISDANVPSDLSLLASGIRACSAGEMPEVPKA